MGFFYARNDIEMTKWKLDSPWLYADKVIIFIRPAGIFTLTFLLPDGCKQFELEDAKNLDILLAALIKHKILLC